MQRSRAYRSVRVSEDILLRGARPLSFDESRNRSANEDGEKLSKGILS
jgi:hypothetical protein